eukprot:2871474-Rhodomonas_salina.2
MKGRGEKEARRRKRKRGLRERERIALWREGLADPAPGCPGTHSMQLYPRAARDTSYLQFIFTKSRLSALPHGV